MTASSQVQLVPARSVPRDGATAPRAFREATQSRLAAGVQSPDALMRGAVTLAEHGIPVFPVGASKQPSTSRGFIDATTDLDTIQRRWRFAWRFKGARVAMPTGGGIFVLDIDTRHGGTVDPRVPATFAVGTMSGGAHLYFTTHHELPCSAGKLSQGVDVRCDGGYVVIPPSDGYTVLQDLPLAPLPDWLAEAAAAPRGGGLSRGGTVSRGGPIVKLGERIAAGSRNAGLASVTGQLMTLGWDGDDLLDRVEAYNARMVDPPCDEREVRRIVGSVVRSRERSEVTA